MTDETTTPAPAKKAAPRKRTAAKPTAKKATARKPRAVTPGDVPPLLEAVDVPPKPRKQTARDKSALGHRRGATAPPTPDELVAQRERAQKALVLAAAGVSDWEEIAKLAGFESKSGAWRAVQSALNRQEFAAAADYRRLIGYRLERIVRANWEAALSQTESTAKDRSTTRLFRAFEQLRRTFGLDLEVDKLVDAFNIPQDPEERERQLLAARDELRSLRVVGGTDVEIPVQQD